MSEASDLLASVLEAIRAKRSAAERRGLRLVGVAGSVARGEAVAASDVDVIYEVSGRPTLFDLGEIQMDIEQALGRSVDLVDLKTVKPRIREAMERDLVRV